MNEDVLEMLDLLIGLMERDDVKVVVLPQALIDAADEIRRLRALVDG